METLFGSSWGWCLIPLVFMALAMVGCVLMAVHGGCGCRPSR